MDLTLFTWISIITIFLLGTLAHFLYDLSHENKILGLFTAVNESTWEHVKIAITPTLLWSLLDGYFYGDNPNYFTAKFTSLMILTFFIPFVFYSYTRATKKPILPIDIITFLVAIILAQQAFQAIITLPAFPYWATYLSATATFIFFGAYMTLTLMPLKQIPFRDPITHQYGFRAHRNFFKSRRSRKK
ncbi:hypothetical protein IJJ37_03175 [Candidatus Saccharibacteria bacterium]|nr:hypothetical protein [Candidatus Saccharibacteria bacterium]MBQ6375903.1 hypothetical protein [Candidatus Saccharibacteria bacterium]